MTGRGGQTRTDNPSLPKRVRYQLRHTPIQFSLSLQNFSVLINLFCKINCDFKRNWLASHFARNAWGGRWVSNPRPPEPQPDALPTELRPPCQLIISKEILMCFTKYYRLPAKKKNDDLIKITAVFPVNYELSKLGTVHTRTQREREREKIKNRFLCAGASPSLTF